MNQNKYESPLSSRYASQEMQYIFSPDKKFSTCRTGGAYATKCAPGTFGLTLRHLPV